MVSMKTEKVRKDKRKCVRTSHTTNKYQLIKELIDEGVYQTN